MATESVNDPDTLSIEGRNRIVIPREGPPEQSEWTLIQESVGVECTSGERTERNWTGIPVLDLLSAADIPGETTHVLLESSDGDRACVPLSDLGNAIVAVGTDGERPRFVSPDVIGPRTVKRLSEVRPLSLAAGEDRERYEDLPSDEE